MELALLPCPFCGKPAEGSQPIRSTIEETMEAEPMINCSQPRCAGRHVCATVSEWQYRTARIAELESQLAAAQERERWHFELPPSRGWYWCACGRFGGVQMSVYYTPNGTWNGHNVVAWRFLPDVPELPEADHA